MTSATQWLVDRDPNAEPLGDLSRDIRPLLALGRVRIGDTAYVRNSFAEGHKDAPGARSMTWRYYKRYVVPELHAVLRHASVETIAAYLGDDIVGWLAFSRGTGRVDAIHWAHTRYRIGDEGEPLRRRKVMTALLDAANLRRIAYTWRGGLGKHDHDGKTSDERLLPWLAARGQHAAYVPWDEWIA